MDMAELEKLIALLEKYCAYHAAYRPPLSLAHAENQRQYMEWAKELYHFDFTLMMVHQSYNNHKDAN